jgi:hypothetical protein
MRIGVRPRSLNISGKTDVEHVESLERRHGSSSEPFGT